MLDHELGMVVGNHWLVTSRPCKLPRPASCLILQPDDGGSKTFIQCQLRLSRDRRQADVEAVALFTGRWGGCLMQLNMIVSGQLGGKKGSACYRCVIVSPLPSSVEWEGCWDGVLIPSVGSQPSQGPLGQKGGVACYRNVIGFLLGPQLPRRRSMRRQR